jgi:N6-adenosine-specific RNA methylase IME4
MLPAVIQRRATDQELLAIADQARGKAVALVEGMKGALERVQDPRGLEELRAWVLAAAAALPRLIQDRKTKLMACQSLAEARLRVERAIGAWLTAAINHSGGGDRRSLSHGATANQDLPQGITRSDSSRFQSIARIPETAFERWLCVCRDKGAEITTKGALRLAKALECNERRARGTTPASVRRLNELVSSETKFCTIYADPPWRYDNRSSNGAAENHYGTMTVEEIAALPVGELSAANAHCHLWATSPFLREAMAVLFAWGFEYKGLLTWCKRQMGTGNYWRSATEFLLLGVRGECPFRDHSIPNWLLTDRTRHSEKPEAVRQLIERVSPGPHLELFARKLSPRWTVWGNEVSSTERG